MNKNIIQILKAHNQEVFYSSFIAWLLDCKGDHGLGHNFINWFLKEIGCSTGSYSVKTEHSVKGGRADILLESETSSKIVIENKTKSIGSVEQLRGYQDTNTRVIPMGIVPENFPMEVRSSVITYSSILKALRMIDSVSTPLSILVSHFKSHLESLLLPFDLLSTFCEGRCSLDEIKQSSQVRNGIANNQNDYRFFQAVYFERLSAYLRSMCPKLVFGDDEYFNTNSGLKKPGGTKWIIEKNMRGPAFMEAIIYDGELPGKLSFSKRWASLFPELIFSDMSPRIELWAGPDDIFKKEIIGVFQIGCWNDGVKKCLASTKVFKRRGKRNFHHRPLKIEDLVYKNMAQIMQEEMNKVWELKPTS